MKFAAWLQLVFLPSTTEERELREYLLTQDIPPATNRWKDTAEVLANKPDFDLNTADVFCAIWRKYLSDYNPPSIRVDPEADVEKLRKYLYRFFRHADPDFVSTVAKRLTEQKEERKKERRTRTVRKNERRRRKKRDREPHPDDIDDIDAMDETDASRLLTIKDAAKASGITQKELKEYILDGTIVAFVVGHRVMIPAQEIL